ncbi:MAG: PAS domain-containing protein [Planctomycetes bacterium]|nr:PAS domain-containing protein [Planctomycetota bacterium]
MSQVPDPNAELLREIADLKARVEEMERQLVEHQESWQRIRDNQESLDVLLNAIPEAAFLIDTQGFILEANHELGRRFGLTREDVLGRCAFDLIPPEVAKERRRHADGVIETGESRRFLDRRGDRIIDNIITPVFDENRRIVRLAMLGIDVTDRQTAQEALRAAYDELEARVAQRTAELEDANRKLQEEINERKRAEMAAADRHALQEQLLQAQKMEAVGQLAAGVAHDFTNLITIIRGYATQAAASLLPDHVARQALRSILDATRQASGLTHSLQTFSRKMPIERRALDLRRLVEEAERLIRPTLPASITLEILNDASSPLWVMADASQMHQVLLNLAINARDAMPEGGRLQISVREAKHKHGRRKADGEALITVTDTGIGITEESLPRIFEPFFTTKPRERNSGLGLSIVQSIVEEHGGRVEVESARGEGTVFTVTLPRTEAEPTIDEGETIQPMPRGNSELILLAESNPHLAGIIALTLESLGYEVILAGDGRLIPEIARKQRDRLRLVILEGDLPGCRGMTCLRRMQEEGLLPSAVILAGQSEPETAECPPNTIVLPRPFEMPQLARMVYNTLHAETEKENGD